jgi:hypothetical protein
MISGLMKVLSLGIKLKVGWTVFLERKIIGRRHGNEHAEFGAIMGWKALKDAVDNFGKDENGFTQLVVTLEGHDPDDSFSSIPYVCSQLSVLMRRKKDSIFYMRSRESLEVPKYSNHSCQRTFHISDSNPCQRRNSKSFFILGSPRSTEKN